ncbi:Zinc finger protein-like 1 [Eumeta japonica]|uniref:Zinc finger protein-like 1 homolog n=1 Tax=Eumeta variegata TaxID=151549 RepID=A0A4C1Y4Y7_EUMVA|nr:Zinc finger protein-like 1 [Eumeta japonica]
MVTNHPKCIVQSYLQWLQDSDYNPICEICTKNLNEDECIRLTCYHVFHWACAEGRYRALPHTTAPAGYQCPSCATPVFPPPNLVSPVADVLRVKLAGVNWARAGLGLPLLSEDQDLKGATARSQSPLDNSQYYSGSNVDSPRGTPVGASDDESTGRLPNGTPHSIVQIPDDSGSTYDNAVKRSDSIQGQASRKGYKPLEQARSTTNFDHDENKYKQKSTFAWVSRWWKNSLPSSRVRRTGGIYKRYWIMLFVIVIVVVVLVMIGHREVDAEDPFGALQDDQKRILQKN